MAAICLGLNVLNKQLSCWWLGKIFFVKLLDLLSFFVELHIIGYSQFQNFNIMIKMVHFSQGFMMNIIIVIEQQNFPIWVNTKTNTTEFLKI